MAATSYSRRQFLVHRQSGAAVYDADGFRKVLNPSCGLWRLQTSRFPECILPLRAVPGLGDANIAGLQRRHKNLLDIGQEALPTGCNRNHFAPLS
jgi:hypothetical protein